VSYNRKMENRFAKIRELGSKGKRSNPLVLEEFLWENEWVEESPCDGDNLWSAVDEAVGATQGLRAEICLGVLLQLPVMLMYLVLLPLLSITGHIS
jgi:hypothetical protein